jgi:hypothetical protein
MYGRLYSRVARQIAEQGKSDRPQVAALVDHGTYAWLQRRKEAEKRSIASIVRQVLAEAAAK